MLILPFFTKNKDWYKSTSDGFALTELGENIPDVKKDFELFSALPLGGMEVFVDSDGNIIENPDMKKYQAFEEFEIYLEEKYKNRLP